MADVEVHQALYGSQDSGGYRFLARSPGFRDDWLPRAEKLCTGFGDRPAGVKCPAALFACRFDRQHVAVVQVADQGSDDAGRPGAIAFRILLLTHDDYVHWIGDPFELADRFPADFAARDELLTLTWPKEPATPRSVEQLEKILKREDGPTLLGGVQALIDGGKLVFERPEPGNDFLRCLWMLLPTSTRSAKFPATFAFGPELDFDAVIVPRVNGGFPDHVNEEQAEYYPQGRYELSLQTAVEAGDQGWLDQLLARRSMAQTWKLGLSLLVLMVLAMVLSKFALPGNKPRPQPPKDSVPAMTSKLELPDASKFHDLNADEQRRLRAALQALAANLEIEPAPAASDELINAIDRKLGTPDAGRAAEQDIRGGPLLRRLRALLWKHEVLGYNDPRLSPEELIERLRQQLVKNKTMPTRKQP